MTLSWFLLVHKVRSLPARLGALLANLTKCGLGVYMIHYFVVGLGYRLVDVLAVPVPLRIPVAAVFVPVIHPDDCTGCGLCTWSCPTERPAINIVERKAFLGRIGEHYRLGWLDSEDQPHHPHAPKPAPAAPAKPTTPAKPGGLDYLNNMDDPLL